MTINPETVGATLVFFRKYDLAVEEQKLPEMTDSEVLSANTDAKQNSVHQAPA